MRDLCAWPFLFWFLALSSGAFAAEGTFQGKIVDPPCQQQAAAGWIFVQGRNRMIRRVDVAHAVIVFATAARSGQGKNCGPECLAVGQEVRITAEQDASGEWRAKRVEILHPAPGKGSIAERTARPADPSTAPSTPPRVSAFRPQGEEQADFRLRPANGSSNRSLDFARDLAWRLSC